MRWFSMLALLMLVARSVAPCCFADWSSAPHTHVLLGLVTADAFAHHHSMMPCFESSMLGARNLDNGIIFSFPFDDWQNFLSKFLLIALSRAMAFAIFLLLIAQVAKRDELSRLHLAFEFDPPPRRSIHER